LPELRVIELEGIEGVALQAGGPGEREVFRARFERPALPASASVRLLLRHFGDEQSVYINGKLVASFAQRAKTGLPELVLGAELLPEGPSELRVVASAYRDQRARETAERSPPARLRIDGPPPTWQRKLFNGLAQVILQSTGEPGTITLVATSPGLEQAVLTLHSA
jgi:beta-galactosidase